MALEALSSNELLNFVIYDSISSTPYSCNDSSDAISLLPQANVVGCSSMPPPSHPPEATETTQKPPEFTVQGRKKRRRRPKVCKNKEEAETQRMTHIAVERNRRKQMNEHLAVLRSLMPESYVQRGDQASIVGGAIEFVKDLEHVLQSLEAKKFVLQQAATAETGDANDHTHGSNKMLKINPFAQFFSHPQFSCSNLHNNYTSQNSAAIAEIEVTLIETHANMRILSHRRFRQHSKIVSAFQAMFLSILHLNVTTLDPLVLYSISAKVEEGCQLNSADEIAGAVHHMLRIIEEEAILCCLS
ncbi:transcription factor bHLH71-like isoform X2 [Olea europaea var. sylvestris]|uniref:transcription factor bHLH71-like isoform X1 n=1 Tax=Olea europaea var. sylvestris TaxID=158386 RepID=UPI000C1D7720|nr:transcription factor bHLH71-like isoform X1 [Olea europaea var. sylvestris]XP_022881646.1 transcription factor bHLH71-like isoform X2 [Olea europaea var. sylvestris]